MCSRSRGAIAPEVCITFALSENRGRREDRVRAAPAVSCAICAKKTAHEHTGSAGAFRPSLRNGFTAYFVLSPVNGSFATVACGTTSAQLDASTAASGPHDFAVRVRRVRLVAPLASTASHRAFVTIANAPHLAVRRAELMPLICPTGESGIFLREGMDRFYGDLPVGLSLSQLRIRKIALVRGAKQSAIRRVGKAKRAHPSRSSVAGSAGTALARLCPP